MGGAPSCLQGVQKLTNLRSVLDDPGLPLDQCECVEVGLPMGCCSVDAGLLHTCWSRPVAGPAAAATASIGLATGFEFTRCC